MGRLVSILKKKKKADDIENTDPNMTLTDSSSMEDFLKRVSVTGLQSTYAQKLEVISSGEPAKQAAWLAELTKHVAILDSKSQDFVYLVLELKWKFDQSSELLEVYKKFLIALAMSPKDFCRIIIKWLLKYFLPRVEGKDEFLFRVNPNESSQLNQDLCNLAIDMLSFIHKKVPLSEKIVIENLNKRKPHFTSHPYTFLTYIKSLLILSDHIESLKEEILELVFHSVLEVDLRCSRDHLLSLEEDEEEDGDVFSMELDEPATRDDAAKLRAKALERVKWIEANPLPHLLDAAMGTLITYVHCMVHDLPFTFDQKRNLSDLQKLRDCLPGLVVHEGKADGCCQCGGSRQSPAAVMKVYTQFRDVFAKIILPTPLSGHIQFVMYYILGMRVGLSIKFISFLTTKYLENPTLSVELRKNALNYIGSYLVRCHYLQFSLVHSTLETITGWCMNYLQGQRGGSNYYANVSLHPVFYNACQTVFYVFTFRYKDYSRSSSNMKLANDLKIQPLISSTLNPLSVCHENIVNSFAAITNYFQFTYCYTIIEKNKRFKLAVSKDYQEGRDSGSTLLHQESLGCYFPFDPYLLSSSRELVVNIYKEFDGLPEGVDASFSPTSGPAVALDDVDSAEVDDFYDSVNNSVHMRSFTDNQLSPC